MSHSPSEDDKPCADPACRITRRDFVIATGAGISGALMPGLASAAASEKTEPVRSVRVAELSAIKVDTPIAFTYPDEGSPAVLVRLRQSAIGGVGPDNSIVAFSQLCTHKGCPVAYRPERKLFICPCHWSSFDPAKAGQMVIGQGSHSLPRILLRVTDNAVDAVGVDGLIFGRHTNIL